VTVNFGAAKAQMTAENLALFDYFSIPNALFRFLNPVSVPATCSFDISWSGTPGAGARSPVTAPEGSTGELVECEATMQWSAETAGFHFETDPKAPTTSIAARLGKVANGVFAS
jgi:hypothetical protein